MRVNDVIDTKDLYAEYEAEVELDSEENVISIDILAIMQVNNWGHEVADPSEDVADKCKAHCKRNYWKHMEGV